MSPHRPDRVLGLNRLVIALVLILVPPASAAPQEVPRDADPMAWFARLVPGEWRTTFTSGQSMFHAWHWGPGRRSIREMTDGAGAVGQPWREVRVIYWDPGRKQFGLLGLSPFASGVTEGTIRAEGEAADALVDTHQTRGLRRFQSRWRFDGPDRFREALLESTRTDRYELLVEWERVRIPRRPTVRPTPDGPPNPTGPLKPFGPLLARTWDAELRPAAGEPLRLRTTIAWVPLAEAVYVRTTATAPGAAPRHVLDAYVYRHTGLRKLRCLALTDQDGVHEGDVTVLDGGSLEFDLNGSDGKGAPRHLIRLDLEAPTTLRHRVWSVAPTGRTPRLDLRHTLVE